MSLDSGDVFIILRWPADAGLPRYSFATTLHAMELPAGVERVQSCATLETAASIVERLNTQDEDAAA
jgi:hypothetical protein